MAQPNVAREPSMEEILASIRRIIESNDPAVAGKDIARSLAPSYAGDDEMLEEDDELSIADARDLSFMLEAANDKVSASAAPEMRMTAPVATPAPSAAAPVEQPVQAPKSISLADLAARVRAAADRGESMMPRQAQQPESPVMTERMADLRSPVVPAPPVAVAPAEPPMMRQPMPSAQPVPEAPVMRAPVMQPPAAEPVRHDDYNVVSAEMQAALDSAMRHSVTAFAAHESVELQDEDSSRGLISAVAGQQIARSFDELAAAIDGSQRRSLDEMAEEMLRPMLQEWLDDNLPTLVERLVREEIERVARGPRR